MWEEACYENYMSGDSRWSAGALVTAVPEIGRAWGCAGSALKTCVHDVSGARPN